MKHILISSILLFLVSCQKNNEINTCGTVYTYKEEPGVKNMLPDILRQNGLPQSGANVLLLYNGDPTQTSNCCWGSEPVTVESISFLSSSVTDQDGNYCIEAELNSSQKKQNIYTEIQLDETFDLFINYANGEILLANFVEVEIELKTQLSSLNKLDIIFDIKEDYYPFEEDQNRIINMTADDFNIENNQAVFSTKVELIENINLSYNLSINGDITTNNFFTGDSQNPEKIIIQI